jgi:hypothetical protein
MRFAGGGKATERGRPTMKSLEAAKYIFFACNHLKSHETAKALFGKAWTKTA